MNNADIRDLIGKQITKVYINQTKVKGYTLYDIDTIIFEVAKDESQSTYYRLTTRGDCCSTGYIDHVSLPYFSEAFDDNSYGVQSVEWLPVPAELVLAGSVQEEDQMYALRIDLDGYDSIFIEFRNSSNGYHGSNFDLDIIPSIEIVNYVELKESF